ncbi:MAG: DUF433 domain-containing protein [Acidobacteriota bacterium]|nr:DUF433 domain-containing protein [Acidobacteriota bacterium]
MEKISVDPNVCHGRPCINGTRIMVWQILDLLEAGKSFDDILKIISTQFRSMISGPVPGLPATWSRMRRSM